MENKNEAVKASDMWLYIHHSLILFSVFSTILLFPSTRLSAAPPPIRIGATVSLEGKYTKLSLMVQKGYELWAQEVNERGGILGRPIELIFHDDKSQINLVGPLYEQLIADEGVDLVLSPYGSPLTLAASTVTEQHKYVMLAAAASAPIIWSRDYSYIFGIYSTADRYLIGFTDLIARQKMHSIGIIYHKSSFNSAVSQGVIKWAERFGMDIAYSENFTNGEQELENLVKTIRKKPVDALIFCGYPPESYAFIDHLKQLHYRPQAMALTIVSAMPDFYAKIGPFANGIFGASQWEPNESLPFPGSKRFIQNFTSLAKLPPSYHAASAYSACQILEQAIIQAKQIDHEKIRKYIAALDTITIMGRFKVDQHGRQIGHNPILVQWQNGTKEIVYPSNMKTKAPLFSSKKTAIKE